MPMKIFDLIAPVPAMHVTAAIEAAQQHGSIVLGSNDVAVMDELQKRSKIGNADPVFVRLFVSKTGEETPYADKAAKELIGKVALFGKVGRVRHEAKVKKDTVWLARRPKTTIDLDTSWGYWWEILDLALVKPCRRVDSFRKNGGRHLLATFSPHGPTKVEAEPMSDHPVSALKLA